MADAAQPPTGEDHAALRRSFVRGVAWTGAAKGLVQLFTWLSTIFVARILAPEDYGLIQMALVYLGFVGLLNEFGIGAAVVTLRNLSAKQIEILNTLAVLIALASIAVSWLAAPFVARFYAEPQVAWLIMVLSAVFLLTSIRTVPQSLLQKELRFKLVGAIEAGHSLAAAVVTVLLAFAGAAYWSLAGGRIVGSAFWMVATLSRRRARYAAPAIQPVREAIRFSSDIFIARLAWYVYSQAAFILIGRFIGTAGLGIYSFAWTLASMASDKVVSLLVQVMPAYLSRVSDDTAELRNYFLRLTEGIGAMVLPLTWGMALVSEGFVSVVLGERWAGVATPLSILALYASFQSLASLLPQILRVTGDTRFFMKCNIGIALLLQPAIYFALPHGLGAVSLVWVTVYPLLSTPLYLRVFSRLDLGFGAYLRALAPSLCCGICMVGGVLGTRLLLGSELPAAVRLGVEIAGGGIGYLGCGWLFFRERLLAARELLRS